MANNKKRTFMILENQDSWLNKISEEKGVDKSLIVRRALAYYKQEGMKKDKILRKMSEGEV